MKKCLLVITILLSAISLSNAQQVSGSWLITIVSVDNKEQEVYAPIDFLENGELEISGRPMGSWTYDQNTQVLQIVSDKFKELHGTNRVKVFNESALIIENKGARIQLVRLDLQKNVMENQASGLMGTWQVKDDHNRAVTKLLLFEAPDIIRVIEHESGMQTTSEGTWIFNSEKKSLIVIGRLSDIKGETQVVMKSETEVAFINKACHLSAVKKEPNAIGKERLNFNEDDFYDGEGNFKYDADEHKLPWQDAYALMASLTDVERLVYEYSTLIDETGVFEKKTLTADVNVDEAAELVSIDFIFYGYDQYNLPDDAALPPNQIKVAQCTNKLYPQKEMTYRVVGADQLTTAAGTFECTIIEGVDSFGVRKKCWLINDQPGVYAKIIEDKPGDFGHYIIYELLEM